MPREVETSKIDDGVAQDAERKLREKYVDGMHHPNKQVATHAENVMPLIKIFEKAGRRKRESNN
ncbi:hypothetical protein IPM62_00745 [Candidatus Woesebacteria bacterium]|nr:MAG: hypothetical protein IPM62_00745 [Candidatus Woesebacteria bacterium]